MDGLKPENFDSVSAGAPKAPNAPPELADMAARRAAHEAARSEDFPKWRQALEDAKGNVTHAGVKLFPELSRKEAYAAAARQVRRLGLVEYAKQLRAQDQGRSMGRPWQANLIEGKQ